MTNNLVVLHVTRLPKYFGPVELRKYISQFGKVHELYMPKSKKTGNWKDNAFIRLSEEVAPLVASTLNNLLQFNKIIKCEVLADNKRLFRSSKYVRGSTRTLHEEKQTIAAIKRVTALNAREEMDPTNSSVRKSLPHAVRRRKHNFQKRLAAIAKTNSNFTFHEKAAKI